jgi:hypothetical protein
MEKGRDKNQAAVNPKQPPLPLGCFVATVEVEKRHFEPKPRRLPTPDHLFGKQVAVAHPMFGEPCVLEVVDRDNEFVTTLWPNLGGRYVFNTKTGKVRYLRRFGWQLCPEDIAWFRENPLPDSAKKNKPAPQTVAAGLVSQGLDQIGAVAAAMGGNIAADALAPEPKLQVSLFEIATPAAAAR